MMNDTKLAARIYDPEVYSNQTCIEWIFTALQNPTLHKSVFLPPEYLTITNIKAEDIKNPVGGKSGGTTPPTGPVDQDLAALFEKRLTATYSNTLSTLLPAKLTVSTLKPSLLTDAIEESERKLESYAIKTEDEETAAEPEQNENGEFEITESELPQTDITQAENENKEEATKTSKTPLKVPLFMIGALSESYRSRLAKLDESEETDKNEKKLRPHLLTKKTEADRSTADPAEIGTATHLFMQFCDFENVENKGVKAEIERLRENQFILPYHAALMDTDKLEAFFRSSIYKEMKSSGKLRREVRFNIRMPAEQFAPAEKADKVKDETLLVQGVIDCYYETEDGKNVLLDYKTDSFPADMPKKQIAAILRKRHANQLYYYKQALERLLLRPVDKVVVYSFALGDSISLRFPKNGKAPYSK